MPTATDTRRHRRHGTRSRARDEQGSASVEFLALAFILLVPVIYLLLFVSQLQAAAYGAVAAADQAARTAVSQEQETATASVHGVVRRTLMDYGVLEDMYEMDLECHPGSCLDREPGMVAQVHVRVQVPLPVLEQVFGVQATPVSITSDARHRVPRF